MQLILVDDAEPLPTYASLRVVLPSYNEVSDQKRVEAGLPAPAVVVSPTAIMGL